MCETDLYKKMADAIKPKPRPAWIFWTNDKSYSAAPYAHWTRMAPGPELLEELTVYYKNYPDCKFHIFLDNKYMEAFWRKGKFISGHVRHG